MGLLGGKLCAVKLTSLKFVLIYVPASHACTPVFSTLTIQCYIFSLCQSIREAINMYASFMLCVFCHFEIFYYVYCVCEYVSICLLTQVNVIYRGERTTHGHCFSFHYVGRRDRTQVVRLDSKCPYLLNHFDSPILLCFKELIVFPFQGLHTSSSGFLVHFWSFIFSLLKLFGSQPFEQQHFKQFSTTVWSPAVMFWIHNSHFLCSTIGPSFSSLLSLIIDGLFPNVPFSSLFQ